MNVFELFAKLGLDTSEYEKGLTGAESKASKFGNAVKVAGGVAAAGLAVATAATAAGTRAFVGGVSSVAQYGDSVDKMSQKMNMSAKAYQEWDFIMQHCGTSMSALRTSIKTLSTAAEKGNEAFKELGMSQEDIANMSGEELFSATITALQGVQDENKRTYLTSQLLGKGATELGALLNMSAEETENMKKQASELGGVLSDKAVKDAAQFQDSLQNMQTAFSGLKNNMLADFLPAFSTTMDGMSLIFSGTDVEGGLAKIEGGVKGLVDGLIAKAPEFMRVGGAILNALITSVSTNLPVLLQAGVPIIMELANGIIQNAPSILSAVLALIGTIGASFADPNNLASIIKSAVDVVLVVANAISQNAPTVIPAIVDVIMQMVTALTDESVLMPLLEAGLQVILAIVQGILKAIPTLIKNLPAIIKNIVNFLVKSTPLIIQASIQLLGGIIKAIPDIIVELAKALPSIIKTLVEGLGAGLSQIVKVGSDLIKGLWKGINDMSKWIGEKIKGFGKGVVDKLKDFFGIHSPSTLFAEMGGYLAEGLEKGFEDEMPNAVSDMLDAAKNGTDDIANALTIKSAGTVGTSSGNAIAGLGNVTINVYGAEGQDIRSLAKAVSQEIQNLISNKEKVYA